MTGAEGVCGRVGGEVGKVSRDELAKGFLAEELVRKAR